MAEYCSESMMVSLSLCCKILALKENRIVALDSGRLNWINALTISPCSFIEILPIVTLGRSHGN